MPGNARRPSWPANWVSPAIVSIKWQRDVAAHGGAFPGSGRQAEPAAELARLTRELAHVTEERDILKKAARYFARESA